MFRFLEEIVLLLRILIARVLSVRYEEEIVLFQSSDEFDSSEIEAFLFQRESYLLHGHGADVEFQI